MERKVYLSGKVIAHVKSDLKSNEIYNTLAAEIGLNSNEYFIICNGKKLDNELDCRGDISIHLRLLGGKGGFGSMLRAIGAQIEKTTNREACRDLSGRRLRDINEEKRLKSWLEKQKDREEEAIRKRKKKLERLMAVPKHEFQDSEYENARANIVENVNEAIEKGIKTSLDQPKETIKRKAENESIIKSKKPALWIDEDLSSCSSTESSDNESQHNDSASISTEESSKSTLKSINLIEQPHCSTSQSSNSCA